MSPAGCKTLSSEDKDPGVLRIALAQINSMVGDLRGNKNKIIDAINRARDELDAQLVVFPELSLCGYPPEDLLLRPGFARHIDEMLEEILKAVRGIDVILGYPRREAHELYNTAGLMREGTIVAEYYKHELPNYSVFDEKRYFSAGQAPCVVDVKGIPVGLTVCEDVWADMPSRLAADAGAKLIININASPFHQEKEKEREAVIGRRVEENRLPFVYCNLVGGQDELVFDGGSFVMNDRGEVCFRAPTFEEGIYTTDLSVAEGRIELLPQVGAELLPVTEAVYRALVLGVRDYIDKNGFSGVVIGLSGGIDSALTLAIAVDALGAKRVEAVLMPSRYTATMSLEDAMQEAERLAVPYHIVSIEPVFDAFLDSLKDVFAGLPADTTEENIQARCRGVLLMAISNKKRKIVLTTGNKSEMAVGYATLYGDMAGGYDVLKDVPKTLVYQLAEFRNRNEEVIPRRVIERPPSAELAADQKDTDSLPPYDILDDILYHYVEKDEDWQSIVAAGYDKETVLRVTRLVDRNEYKRRQAPPGVRITRRAFSRDRRYPITSGYGKYWD
jgi:NAD+ synthase (glutamine-hydrolysing)